MACWSKNDTLHKNKLGHLRNTRNATHGHDWLATLSQARTAQTRNIKRDAVARENSPSDSLHCKQGKHGHGPTSGGRKDGERPNCQQMRGSAERRQPEAATPSAETNTARHAATGGRENGRTDASEPRLKRRPRPEELKGANRCG